MWGLAVLFLFFHSSLGRKIENLVTSNQWSQYKSKYNLNITSDEEDERKAIFLDNVRYIEEFNAKNKSFKLEINKFAHMRISEMKFGAKRRPLMQMGMNYRPTPGLPVKKSMDWRTYGVVTAVRDQGKCGACYVFSAIGAWESHLAIKTGHLVTLSKQEVIDCSDHGWNDACAGGQSFIVFEYGMSSGVSLESDYEYTEKVNECVIRSESAGLKAQRLDIVYRPMRGFREATNSS
ncbi:Cathepsin 7 [Thelohanellus kitauei]|uniref:Cathepsin 7 n=1 Tax=Thelohanellus kitauei TaxID=669202 RepID=A0A0C2MU70_THEKT|nr:Cathepsin 7 [Thelohanellus kitauei]